MTEVSEEDEEYATRLRDWRQQRRRQELDNRPDKSTTTTYASAEEYENRDYNNYNGGVGDDDGGGSGSKTGPVDWQRQQNVDFTFHWVDNSNNVSSLSSRCLVLIFFSSDYFLPFAAINAISNAIMRKVFLYQVYTNLAYVPPTYR